MASRMGARRKQYRKRFRAIRRRRQRAALRAVRFYPRAVDRSYLMALMLACSARFAVCALITIAGAHAASFSNVVAAPHRAAC